MKKKEDSASASAPKMKFGPKIPPQKQAKASATKVEPSETKSDLIDKELLTKLDAVKSLNSFGRRLKTERKAAPVQVAFGQGSSSSIRSFGNPGSEVAGSKHEDDFAKSAATVKEYVEPWDYVRTHYPVTLPLRRPYSGDPEILDQEEFGEDTRTVDNNPALSPAEELGLMESSIAPQMFIFQFPEVLPLVKPRAASADGKENDIKPETMTTGKKASGSRPDIAAAEGQRNGGGPSDGDDKLKRGCTLRDLSSGFIGKLLVYKSGKVKMKIGDTIFDVSPGENCMFAQDAALINVKEKHCCVLGDLPKRVVVTPDVDALSESMANQ